MVVLPVHPGYRRRRLGAAWLLAAVLAAAAVAASCTGSAQSGSPTTVDTSAPSGSSTTVATPVPSLPGTPGHYDDGEMSFDYPTDWPVLAARAPEECGVIYVLAVLGTGSWADGTNQPQPNGAYLCGLDSVTVTPGGVVVRIYWRGGGPAPECAGYTQANATFGANAVQETLEGSVTSLEIRLPGGEFFEPNDPIFEVHTFDPALLAKAEAMVASFRWGANAPTYEGLCSPSPAVAAAT